MEPDRHAWSRFLDELRTRRVSRVAVTYMAAAFVGLQGADVVLSPLGGDRVYRWIVILTLAGFPVALLVAWFFDFRREGQRQVYRGGVRSAGGPRRRWSRGRRVVIGTLLLAGLGLLAYRVSRPVRIVVGAAEVIAVAPFAAVGGGDPMLGEGMAQLVSANLDEVGGLRTLDPTRVLRAWGGTGAERRSEAEALALGRRLGAGSVLIGTVVAAGDGVRLSSVLRGVTGQEIARAQVTGSASDVLVLADSLSNRLLREIWRSRSPIPQLRIAAITTSDLDAIRAYLEGERYYRELRWDSAVAALEKAVEEDSTFALAHRRLADVYGWTGDFDSPQRSREEEAAASMPERLPERERGIAAAYRLWHRENDYLGALDSLDSQLRRYPDDAEALNLRAEVLAHGVTAGAVEATDSALLAAFEAALQVDPDLVPGMIHPLGISVRMGDSVRFRRYATRILGTRLRDSTETAHLVDSAVGLFWGEVTSDGRFVRRLLTDSSLRTIGWELSPLPTLISMGRDPNAAADALLDVPLEGVDTLSLMIIANSLIGIGRLSEAASVLEQLGEESPETPFRLRVLAVAFGLAGRDFAPMLWPVPPFPVPDSADAAWTAPAEAWLDLSAGDTTAAAEALEAAAAARDRLPPAVDALRRLQVGRLRAMRGDVVGGIQAMETALLAAEAAPPVGPAPPAFVHRIVIAAAHSSYPPTRSRGIEELSRLLRSGPPQAPLVRIYLARALEEDGQPQAALENYVIFAAQTHRAEGPLAALHAEAEAAVERLAAEG